MERIVKWSIKNRTAIYFAMLFFMFAGIYAYRELGKLEDPEFTIKRAIVVTPYPGASARQVEQEVTDLIETTAQELHQLDQVESISRPGLSIVFVDIKERYWADDLPQVWDKLRWRIRDIQPQLPPGALPSMVNDDFGDVFGVLFALTSEQDRPTDLKEYAEDLQRMLLRLEDVSRVRLWGVQTRCVYIEVSRGRLAERGIAPEAVLHTLATQNMMVDPGHADVGSMRIRLNVTGEFESIEEIRDLLIRAAPEDELLRIGDVATVREGHVEPPERLMRFNGHPAVGVAVAVKEQGNVIRMGRDVRNLLDRMSANYPAGISIAKVSFQPDVVRSAIREFMLNLFLAVSIVIVLLLGFMGWRPGLLIGVNLILTIAATFVIMFLLNIELQRVSLGALIVALGMLVDNAVVVTEGSYVRLQRGEHRLTSITTTVSETAVPLLVATLVAILAFMPIFLSPDDVGEYTRSLFQVVAISLLCSWVLSVSYIPAACHAFLRVPSGDRDRAPHDRAFYRGYRTLLAGAIRRRRTTLGCALFLMLLAILGFSLIEQMFFPEAVRPQLRIDYWLPEGSRIEAVSADLETVEAFVLEQDEVASVASFIGSGPPRFYLPLRPQIPTPVFGQLIVNLTHSDHAPAVRERLENALRDDYPQAESRVRKFPMGPATPFKIEVRFEGPDRDVLRDLADQATQIMREDPYAKDIRHDWRQRTPRIDVFYDQRRARWAAGPTRQNVAHSLRRSFEGRTIGLYRDEDDLLPVIVRLPGAQRHDAGNIGGVQVWGDRMPYSIPLEQAIRDLRITFEDSLIRRRNRRRSITAQCDPRAISASALRKRLKPAMDAIDLPEGYDVEWGGEHQESVEARASVYRGMPIIAASMLLLMVFLFNSLRKPLLIVALLPLAMVGITTGLMVARIPFGFLALLGGFSLAGMMIKNSVVLIEQVDLELQAGKKPFLAVLEASVNRVRPVLMASMTTVMGMIPLLFDRFWTSMGVTITVGLSFATVLTLLVLPVLYTLCFRIDAPDAQTKN